MVNYAKWDNLEVSDDEDDARDKKPRVTAFDAPQAVTIGGPNSDGSLRISPSAEAQPDSGLDVDDDEPMEVHDDDIDLACDHREDALQCRALADRALRGGEPQEAVRLLEKAKICASAGPGGGPMPGLEDMLQAARRQLGVHGSEQLHGSSASASWSAASASKAGGIEKNGGCVEDRYSWSQTQETVEIHMYVPQGTKARSVSIEVTDERLGVSLDGRCLLAGDWEFKVAPEEVTDWELTDCGSRRAIRLLVRKAPVPGGMSVVVWWKRILKGEPSIDVTGIDGRKLEKVENFSKAWDEAHTRFKANVQNRVPIPIDVDGNVVERCDDMDDSG